MKRKFYFFSLCFIFCFLVHCKDKETVNNNIPQEGKKSEFIKAKIDWNYIDIPAEMKIYEVKSQIAYNVWDTQSVSSIDSSPASTEIPESTIVVQSGRYKEFVLGMQNNTDKF